MTNNITFIVRNRLGDDRKYTYNVIEWHETHPNGDGWGPTIALFNFESNAKEYAEFKSQQFAAGLYVTYDNLFKLKDSET